MSGEGESGQGNGRGIVTEQGDGAHPYGTRGLKSSAADRRPGPQINNQRLK